MKRLAVIFAFAALGIGIGSTVAGLNDLEKYKTEIEARSPQLDWRAQTQAAVNARTKDNLTYTFVYGLGGGLAAGFLAAGAAGVVDRIRRKRRGPPAGKGGGMAQGPA